MSADNCATPYPLAEQYARAQGLQLARSQLQSIVAATGCFRLRSSSGGLDGRPVCATRLRTARIFALLQTLYPARSGPD